MHIHICECAYIIKQDFHSKNSSPCTILAKALAQKCASLEEIANMHLWHCTKILGHPDAPMRGAEASWPQLRAAIAHRSCSRMAKTGYRAMMKILVQVLHLLRRTIPPNISDRRSTCHSKSRGDPPLPQKAPVDELPVPCSAVRAENQVQTAHQMGPILSEDQHQSIGCGTSHL